MKKIIATFLFMGILAAGYSQDQNVKVGPLGFVFGNYNLRYEKVLSDKGTFQVGANYFDFSIGDTGVTSFGVDGGYRHYFKEAMRGAYVFPSVGLQFAGAEALGEDESATTLGIGATIGYQWITGGDFVIDLGLGYGRTLVLSTSDGATTDFGRGGPRFQFAIGYAF